MAYPPPPSASPFIPASPGSLEARTRQALNNRLQGLYARHPVQFSLERYQRSVPHQGSQGFRCVHFPSAEGIYRAGAQGLRLPEVPILPQSVAQLSRLGVMDKAGRAALRAWIQAGGTFLDEAAFLARWEQQGRLGGAEHQVFFDEPSSLWHKRLYACVLGSTLGDYLDRMMLHAVVFPETAYRLVGFSINPRNRNISPIVSQPHVAVATDSPPVSLAETRTLMSEIGFEPIRLRHNGVLDDGYFAFYHHGCGILAHDLHDENVVRMQDTGELAVIDPYLSLARNGTWAALKLAEVGIAIPPDDILP